MPVSALATDDTVFLIFLQSKLMRPLNCGRLPVEQQFTRKNTPAAQMRAFGRTR